MPTLNLMVSDTPKECLLAESVTISGSSIFKMKKYLIDVILSPRSTFDIRPAASSSLRVLSTSSASEYGAKSVPLTNLSHQKRTDLNPSQSWGRWRVFFRRVWGGGKACLQIILGPVRQKESGPLFLNEVVPSLAGTRRVKQCLDALSRSI